MQQTMKQLRIILIIICGLILISCDCRQHIHGKIIDNNTQLPIDSAFIQKENRTEQYSFTDKEGNFELTSISGGFYNCPPMKVIIAKEGYDTIRKEIEVSELVTIRLIRTKTNNKQ
jgi:hypothetical protein